MSMRPEAAWLALNGWEPYYVTATSRYVFLGAHRYPQYREMVMMWPEVMEEGAAPTVQLMDNGSIRKQTHRIDWCDVPWCFLKLTYDMLAART